VRGEHVENVVRRGIGEMGEVVWGALCWGPLGGDPFLHFDLGAADTTSQAWRRLSRCESRAVRRREPLHFQS